MRPSAAACPQSCAACCAVLIGVPHPKMSPVPQPAPSWPRTLPPEKPGGAFLAKAPQSSAVGPGLALGAAGKGEPTGNWLQACERPGGQLPDTFAEEGEGQQQVAGPGVAQASTPGQWTLQGAPEPFFPHLSSPPLPSLLTVSLINIPAPFPPHESPWTGVTAGVGKHGKARTHTPAHTHAHRSG